MPQLVPLLRDTSTRPSKAAPVAKSFVRRTRTSVVAGQGGMLEQLHAQRRVLRRLKYSQLLLNRGAVVSARHRRVRARASGTPATSSEQSPPHGLEVHRGA